MKVTRDDIDAAVRRRQHDNPPPPLSDRQIVRLRRLMGIDERSAA